MKLSDFYRNVVDASAAETAGWSTYYYGVMRKVINENNYKIIAEVGIGYGTHAKELLAHTSLDRLYLIDPMVFYPNDAFAADVMNTEPSVPGNQFNEFAELIRNELYQWESRYTWFRQPSLTITDEQIPEKSIDCVFIDGDHSYDAVLADITFWWTRIRSGGQMLGDDYWMKDVRRAVDTFALNNDLTYDFLYRPGTTYKIYRFRKQ